MKRIDGLREIADQFDLFLVDQYGVLHDGIAAYPGAIEALTGLSSPNRQVVVLTNSGKGAAANRARLMALGFAGSHYGVVSSGDVALQRVKTGAQRAGLVAGSTVCVIGRAGDSYAFSSDDFTLVDRPEQAAWLVIAGSDAPHTSLDDYRAALTGAAQHHVPALCVNPDITMIREGALIPAPGAIARIYRDLGGRVDYVGKPYPAIFQAAHAMFAQVPPHRVIMIGDSPEHDMVGARSMGFATLLVRTGIHRELGEAEFMRLCASHGGPPDFLGARLDW
jgi:HAD superfamily hydrolase (TIGR01459 family)